ncbi:hypothetical protein K435DRAFT_114677 [Dendrothele bispora CBS 962.96]|uniref:Uncharacterized protein n=1 Tax=Dendrothele bispora (strain CBS 962.96) TaxID=1314807 RepID=A0A4S8KMZ4_DENBC|nr:hypothetical protein K435DRAFT_114677 [Dendrothele bispora CBS 962.96]
MLVGLKADTHPRSFFASVCLLFVPKPPFAFATFSIDVNASDFVPSIIIYTNCIVIFFLVATQMRPRTFSKPCQRLSILKKKVEAYVKHNVAAFHSTNFFSRSLDANCKTSLATRSRPPDANVFSIQNSIEKRKGERSATFQ